MWQHGSRDARRGADREAESSGSVRRPRKGMWCSLVCTAITAVAVTTLSSCAAPPKGSPSKHRGRAVYVVRTIPPQPTERTSHGACAEPLDVWDFSGGGSPNEPVIAVSKNPTSALVYWLPGGNAKPCQVAASTLTEQQARRFARAIDRDSPMGNGPIACPASDGSAAEVYFRFADGTIELADVDLNGCEQVEAPDRYPVGITTLHPAASVLLGFAPKTWLADNPEL